MTETLTAPPPQSHRSTSSESGETSNAVYGRTEPRLWTPPLRELTPETSYGFGVIEFGKMIGRPLDPWQEWAVIHGGELLPDGRPRFRKLLILVSRQNGKTELLVVLTLYWLFVERVAMVLGTSTKLDYAAESWRKACRLARRCRVLAVEVPARGGIRKVNGEQMLWRATDAEQELDTGSRYKVAASNEEGGRSMTIDRLVLDELRQHHDYSAHDAAVYATNAVPDAQVIGISNAGSDKSVVLNDWRDAALTFIDTGEGDERTGLFEWSAPEGSSPLDLDALAQANPNLGYRLDPDALLGEARTAVAKGGEKLTGFMTESMCMNVKVMNPAVDGAGWESCLDPGTLDAVRARVQLCLDVSLDEEHATLVAAAMLPDGRVRVETVKAWSGPFATKQLRRDLPGLVAKVQPQRLGWLPAGPAAAIAAVLAESTPTATGRPVWPPPGVTVDEIRSETPAVCMGLAELVRSEELAHSGDELLTAHVTSAEKLRRGDAWVFTRRGGGHCDAAYAVAGAVHLARTAPAPVGTPRVITRRRR